MAKTKIIIAIIVIVIVIAINIVTSDDHHVCRDITKETLRVWQEGRSRESIEYRWGILLLTITFSSESWST